MTFVTLVFVGFLVVLAVFFFVSAITWNRLRPRSPGKFKWGYGPLEVMEFEQELGWGRARMWMRLPAQEAECDVYLRVTSGDVTLLQPEKHVFSGNRWHCLCGPQMILDTGWTGRTVLLDLEVHEDSFLEISIWSEEDPQKAFEFWVDDLGLPK